MWARTGDLEDAGRCSVDEDFGIVPAVSEAVGVLDGAFRNGGGDALGGVVFCGRLGDVEMDDVGPARCGYYVLDRAETAVAVVVVVGEIDGMRVNGIDVVGGTDRWVPDGSQVLSFRSANCVKEKFDLGSSSGDMGGIGECNCRVRKMVDCENVYRIRIMRG